MSRAGGLLPAVRVLGGLQGADLLTCDLGPEPEEFLRAARGREAPAVYVVREDDLPALRRLRRLVVDRGAKRASKALAPRLLGLAAVPLIAGGYRSAGQLLRSARTLLRHALKRDDANLFLIAAGAELFDELWRRAGRAPARAGGSARRLGAGDQPALLDLLPPLPVPPLLRRRFIGDSSEAELVRQLVLRAARQEEPVLLLGDTGTGKEVVARLIHDQSARRAMTFTPVNCGAIPRELLESELFGYEPGSHSTARARKLGLWRVAHRGTLFLDEIADLSLDHQVKILRALESGEVRPVGAEEAVKVDARVIAATNRDLFAMVRAGEFREDLYYRLRSLLIRTPALRDHPLDIPDLAEHFWRGITKDPRARLPVPIREQLAGHRWPGNSRELKMTLASLFGLFGQEDLGVEHLRAVLQFEGHGDGPLPAAEADLLQHRVDCLRHLRRADEVARACRVTLRPLRAARGASDTAPAATAASLRERLAELEVLCQRPLLFHGEVAFAVVHRLKGKLFRLLGHLERRPGRARAYWRDELAEEFRLCLATLFREVKSLLRES